MTPQEFREWTADLSKHFPSIAAWLNDLGAQRKADLLSLWQRVLGDVALADALEVNWRMFRGDDQPVGQYTHERERAASHVRSLARALHRTSEPSEADTVYTASRFSPTRGKATRGVMARIQELVEGGMDKGKAIEQVMGKLKTREPRYHCHLCQDSGLVTVWSWWSMQAVRADGIAAEDAANNLDNPANRRTMAVACQCKSGDKFVGETDPKQRIKRWPEDRRYTSERYFAIPQGNVNDPDMIREFRSWCTAYFELREQEELESLSGYNPAFDRFNEN